MMPETFTLDEVNALVLTIVHGIRTGDNGDDRVYSLDEVHERTGFSLRRLENDCRDGVIEHVHRGNVRGLTSRQIAILVARHSQGGDLAHRGEAEHSDDIAQAIEMTRNSGAKRGASRGRAA